MADRKASEKPQEPAKVAAEAAREADPAEDAPTYTVERLTGPEARDLTGYPGHVVAGALTKVSKKNLTRDEATAAVEAWLKTPLEA